MKLMMVSFVVVKTLPRLFSRVKLGFKMADENRADEMATAASTGTPATMFAVMPEIASH
jgi:hypothetical protein